VANEVPSVHDLGQEGVAAATVVDPFDVSSIATGLFTVLTDDRVRAELAARGEAHARTRTWRAVAELHGALWRSLT
jgi:hypothetical protein